MVLLRQAFGLALAIALFTGCSPPPAEAPPAQAPSAGSGRGAVSPSAPPVAPQPVATAPAAAADPARSVAAVPGVERTQPVRSVEDCLAPQPTSRFRFRALLGWTPKVYWTLSAQQPANPSTTEEKLYARIELVAVETQADRVRIVAETGGVRYAAYVGMAALREVATTSARLEPSEGAPKPPSGITLAPGFVGDWGETRSGRRFLNFADEQVRFRGSVKASTVGRVFEPKPLPAPNTKRFVPARTPIVDVPGGRSFASTGPADDREGVLASSSIPVVVREERDGHARVVIGTPHYRVEGWVPIAALTDWGGLGGLGLSGMGAGLFSGPPVTLDEGTRLFAEPNGPQVGVVIIELRAPLREAKDGWRAIRFHGDDLGELVAWLEPKTAAAATELERSIVRAQTKVKYLQVASVRGLPEAIAERVMAGHSRHVQRCYVDAHRAGEAPSGLLTLSLQLDSEGKIRWVQVGGRAASNHSFKACLKRRFGRMALPNPKGGSGHLRVEFEIAPGPLAE